MVRVSSILMENLKIIQRIDVSQVFLPFLLVVNSRIEVFFVLLGILYFRIVKKIKKLQYGSVLLRNAEFERQKKYSIKS